MSSHNQPGPAPVAQMYVQDTDMDNSDAESVSSNASSGTTSSAETTGSDTVDWAAVGVDYIVTQDALDALGKREPMPRPPPPLKPPPRRKSLDGDKMYVQWVPYWSDPAWNDQHFTLDQDGVPIETVEVHPVDKQRPALLPKDALRNPTPYAKRFGIFANRTDGRSQMSPTFSVTRRVQLPRPTETPTGRKDYITIQDLHAFVQSQGWDPAANPSDVSSYLQALLSGKTEDTEQVEALIQLQGLLEEDETLQQAALLGVTSDERLDHDVHSVDPAPVKYDLQGPLHPLVDRTRWASPVSRGDAENNPRFLYNLEGQRGEWCAENDYIWTAIQPALQVVTRVLNTNHPFWLALLTAKSRRTLDRFLIPNGATGDQAEWLSFTTWYATQVGPFLYHSHPDAVAGKHLHVLDVVGFDLPAKVAQFMRERLRLEFMSSAVKWTKGKLPDQTIWGQHRPASWGDPALASLNIEIAAEAAVPLLISEYTPKEKACCSMMLAATLLHELAVSLPPSDQPYDMMLKAQHAANAALVVLLRLSLENHYDLFDPLYGETTQVMEALQGISEEMCTFTEPYFEDEPRNEVGFSFENALFGGTVESAFGGDKILHYHHSMVPLGLGLNMWPHAMSGGDNGTRILMLPHLPIDGLITLLPTETYTKFFDQAFWDLHVPKFGHQALKLNPDGLPLTVRSRNYMRRKDLRRLFGKSHGEWLIVCLNFLRDLGHALLHAYCRDLLMERMEFLWVRKRFHQECRLWIPRTETFEEIVTRINHQKSTISSVLQRIHLPEVQKAQELRQELVSTYGAQEVLTGRIPMGADDVAAYTGRLELEVAARVRELLSIYLELHHHLLHEIRCAQSLVVDYIQQDETIREKLHRHYCQFLYSKIEETLAPYTAEMHSALQQVHLQLQTAGLLTPDLLDDVNRILNHLSLDFTHLRKTKFFLSEDNIFVDGLMWVGELETVPRGRGKQKSRTMKRMAVTEVLRAQPVIRRLVETFTGIIGTNANAARDEEVARSVDSVTERMQQGIHARRGQNRVKQPVRRSYARAPGTVPPWEPARPPTPASRGLVFGRPNSVTPDTSPPSTPTGSASFGRYASPTSGFAQLQENEGVLQSHGANVHDLNPMDHEGFGGGPKVHSGLRLFGTAFSDSRTVSDDLRREGVAVPVARNVFGQADQADELRRRSFEKAWIR